MAARELYVGNHWAIVRDLPEVARRTGWRRVKLWVASGGYGLLDVKKKAVAYAATFTIGHRDSVVDAVSAEPPEQQARRWWRELAAVRAAEEAEAILKGDPFCTHGIFVKWQLRPWNPVIANRDLFPA